MKERTTVTPGSLEMKTPGPEPEGHLVKELISLIYFYRQESQSPKC